MKKKRSYRGLQEDLRCADEEARGYLQTVQRLGTENKQLENYKQGYFFLEKVLKYIIYTEKTNT